MRTEQKAADHEAIVAVCEFLSCRRKALTGLSALVFSLALLPGSVVEVSAQQDALEFEYGDDESYFDALDSIVAKLSNGNVTGTSIDPDFNSITLSVATNSTDGTMRVVLPRSTIDSKDGADDRGFTVVVDATEVSYSEVRSSETERELEIPIPGGTRQVEIVGTRVIPEFPYAIVLLGVVIAGMIAARTKSFR